MKKSVLLCGETFTLTRTATVGYDASMSGSYANGALPFLGALRDGDYDVHHLPTERCEGEFPLTADALSAYAAVILSDVGSLSLLYSPQTRAARLSVNRLVLLRDWVEAGGSLMMAGGYLSFQGMDGKARYHGTALEECLPVECLPHSDGLEAPEGLHPTVLGRHPIVADLGESWPPILGMNKVGFRPDPDRRLVAAVSYRGREHPLLATRDFGRGRSLAWMTDIGPHWMSADFMESPAYGSLMRNMVAWLCRDL